MPLLGGILIDTKGPRIALMLTATLCVIGQIIFGIGGFTNVWMVMLIGRFVFGLGGEVLHAAQNTIISRWFKASELSVSKYLIVGSFGHMHQFSKDGKLIKCHNIHQSIIKI